MLSLSLVAGPPPAAHVHIGQVRQTHLLTRMPE